MLDLTALAFAGRRAVRNLDRLRIIVIAYGRQNIIPPLAPADYCQPWSWLRGYYSGLASAVRAAAGLDMQAGVPANRSSRGAKAWREPMPDWRQRFERPLMQGTELSKDDVARLVGDVSDETIVAILETGATVEEIETALQWIASADDVMGKSGRALSGQAALVYDILLAEQAADDRDR